jgi:hypothetical protein
MSVAASEAPMAVKAGIAASAALALLGLFEYAHFESLFQSQYRDPYKVTVQFLRFADLAAAVPAGAELGYVSDQPLGEMAGDTLFGTAQYALAPRLLRKDTTPDLVVGNFTREMDYREFGAPLGLRVEKTFGSGVVLFKKGGR